MRAGWLRLGVGAFCKDTSLICSHGPGDHRGHAGHAENLEQLQGASQRQDPADAVEGHVRHRGEMEEVGKDEASAGCEQCWGGGKFRPRV